MNEPKTAVVAIALSSSKKSITEFGYQVARIVTKCTQENINVFKIIPTFTYTKDVLAEIKILTAHVDFDFVIVYAPSQIAQTAKEYNTFVATMSKSYGVQVIPYKTSL